MSSCLENTDQKPSPTSLAYVRIQVCVTIRSTFFNDLEQVLSMPKSLLSMPKSQSVNAKVAILSLPKSQWSMPKSQPVNVKVVTVLGSIPASSDTVESEGPQMNQR